MVKTGDKVKTRYNEELVVLDTQERDAKTKKGKVVQEAKTWFKAKSGDHDCWFPLDYLDPDTKGISLKGTK